MSERSDLMHALLSLSELKIRGMVGADDLEIAHRRERGDARSRTQFRITLRICGQAQKVGGANERARVV
jgi:hypothetical protein